MPLASARQHPGNQKENQAGNSSERTAKFSSQRPQERNRRERKGYGLISPYNDITTVTGIMGKSFSNGSLVHSYRVVEFGNLIYFTS